MNPNPITTAHQIAAGTPTHPEATPTRYPSTYARDMIRSHFRDFGCSEDPSRSGAGDVIRDLCAKSGANVEQAFVTLADAYLATTGETLAKDVREQRIRHMRTESWKTLGYDSAREAMAAPMPQITTDFSA